jgi:transcriptional regulator with XRE-family HTH domain
MNIQHLILKALKSGYTQNQLAQKLQISQNSVWQYKEGRVSDPRGSVLMRLQNLAAELAEKEAA